MRTTSLKFLSLRLQPQHELFVLRLLFSKMRRIFARNGTHPMRAMKQVNEYCKNDSFTACASNINLMTCTKELNPALPIDNNKSFWVILINCLPLINEKNNKLCYVYICDEIHHDIQKRAYNNWLRYRLCVFCLFVWMYDCLVSKQMHKPNNSCEIVFCLFNPLCIYTHIHYLMMYIIACIWTYSQFVRLIESWFASKDSVFFMASSDLLQQIEAMTA